MGRTITNPVINGPYDEPRQHFEFDDDGITYELVTGRRRSQLLRSGAAHQEARRPAAVRQRMDAQPDPAHRLRQRRSSGYGQGTLFPWAVGDFSERLADTGDAVVRNLMIEVPGGAKTQHWPGPVSEKADAARPLWIPAVNRHGQWDCWADVEVGNPASARTHIAQASVELAGTAAARA